MKKKLKVFTLAILASAAVLEDAKSTDLLAQVYAKTLGKPVTQQEADQISRSSTGLVEVQQAIQEDPNIIVGEYLQFSKSSPQHSPQVRAKLLKDTKKAGINILNTSQEQISDVKYLQDQGFTDSKFTPEIVNAKEYLRTDASNLSDYIYYPSSEQLLAIQNFQINLKYHPNDAEFAAGVEFAKHGIKANLDDIGVYLANEATRPECIVVAAANLDTKNPQLLAAAKKCTDLGIDTPSPDQIQGAAFSTANGYGAFTVPQLNDLISDPATREGKVILLSMGKDPNNADDLASANLCAKLGVAKPNPNQLKAGDHVGRVLGVGQATTRDQLDATTAFIDGGHNAPNLLEVNGWVNNQATRAARVLVGSMGLDATDPDHIAAALHCVRTGFAKPKGIHFDAIHALVDPYGKAGDVLIGLPTEDDIKATALLIVQQHGSGGIVTRADMNKDQISAVVAATEEDMQKVVAWAIQTNPKDPTRIPGGVARINDITGGGFFFKFYEITKGAITLPPAYILDASDFINPGTDGFRMIFANVTVGKKSKGDVVIFRDLVDTKKTGDIEFLGVAQP